MNIVNQNEIVNELQAGLKHPNRTALVVYEESQVNYGLDAKPNFEYCKEHNISCVDIGRRGGAFVVNKGDIGLGYVGKGLDNTIGELLYNKFVEYLKSRGLNAVAVDNDILIDGYKVFGWASNYYKEYDAIYITIGAQTDKKLGLEGEDAKGVISAVDMLREIGDDNYPDYTGQDIVVVGGGNVAMDVARSSIRLGAKSVKIVYRRRKDDMTALPEEVAGAIEEGCEVMELYAPVKIEKDENGNATALWAKPQIIGPYAWGRPKPMNSDKPEVRIACDKVLIAIGQNIDSCDFENEGIPIKRGNICADNACSFKDIEGVFAGGDCTGQPWQCNRAAGQGQKAALSAIRYLAKRDEEIDY